MAKYWRKEAKVLLERFYTYSWENGRFVLKLSGSHAYRKSPTSLLSMRPLVLSKQPDSEKREKLVEGLR